MFKFEIIHNTVCVKWHTIKNDKSVVIYVLYYFWDLEKFTFLPSVLRFCIK
jgi:hypothetical protein